MKEARTVLIWMQKPIDPVTSELEIARFKIFQKYPIVFPKTQNCVSRFYLDLGFMFCEI